MKTAVYISFYNDEIVPATTLDGWAQWLFKNEPNDGPVEPVTEGQTFEMDVCDIDYHRCHWSNDTLVIPSTVDWTSDVVAVAFDEDMGWGPDDIVADEADAQKYAREAMPQEGDGMWLATMNGREGKFTATYTVIDGEPALQPDGWSL